MENHEKVIAVKVTKLVRKSVEDIVIKSFGHLNPIMVDEVIGVRNIRDSVLSGIALGIRIGSMMQEEGFGIENLLSGLDDIVQDIK